MRCLKALPDIVCGISHLCANLVDCFFGQSSSKTRLACTLTRINERLSQMVFKAVIYANRAYGRSGMGVTGY